MMLPEGINVRLLFLPEGEDPDSFARNHTAADFKKYIEENQKDCIQFKTDYLLQGVTDPVKRSEAINSIIRSLSLIPDNVVRATYIHDTAYRLGMSERVIIDQMNKMIRAGKEKGTTTSQGILPEIRLLSSRHCNPPRLFSVPAWWRKCLCR